MKWGKHMKKYFSKIAASLMAAAIMSMTLNGCSSSSSNANSGSAASSANAVNTNNSDSLENQNGEKQIVKVGVMCPLSGTSSRFGELYKASIDSAMKVIMKMI